MKIKYPSKYSKNKEINAAQYITECICEKKAAIEQIELLPQFWKLEKWKEFFKSQMIAAYGLMKLYHPDSIIKTLRDNRLNTIYSLRHPIVVKVILEYEKERTRPINNDYQHNRVEKSKGRYIVKKTSLDKLDE